MKIKTVYGYCPTCGYTATLSQYSTGRTVHLCLRGIAGAGRTPALTPTEHAQHLTAVSA